MKYKDYLVFDNKKIVYIMILVVIILYNTFFNFEVVHGEKERILKHKIYILGDSTAKDYTYDSTLGGWGEFLQDYFTNDVYIVPKAEGGLSSRSFLNQGRLDDVLANIQQGDFVFIQFGHNDARVDKNAFMEHSTFLGEPDENGIYPTLIGTKSSTPKRIIEFYENEKFPYTETFYPYETGSFKWYLGEYIRKIREKGATPVLLTSNSRVVFDEDGKILPNVGENNGYIKATLQVANELSCDYIDAYEITKNLYEEYGSAMTQTLQNLKEDSSLDYTHYNKFGANTIAGKLADAIKSSSLSLSKYIVKSTRQVSRLDAIKTSNLYLVGDDYMSNFSVDDNKYLLSINGYGPYLDDFLNPLINVKNYAIKGTSAKSYTKSYKYEKLLQELKMGDFVFIQFGKNDGKTFTDNKNNFIFSKANGSKEDKNSFKHWIYNYYIKPIKDKKAVPILITPLREINPKTSEILEEENPYIKDIKDLAKEFKLFFIELDSATKDFYQKLKIEDLSVLYSLDDKTMFNTYFAKEIAKLFMTQVNKTSSTIKTYIDTDALTKDINLSMTKGEFIYNLMTLIQYKSMSDVVYKDVFINSKYYTSIMSASKLGILKADDNSYLYPEKNITKKEAINIIVKLLERIGLLESFDIATLDKFNNNLTYRDAVIILHRLNEFLSNKDYKIY